MSVSRKPSRQPASVVPKPIQQRALIQGGVVSGSELIDLGWTRRTIRTRLAQGVIHRLGGDVFALGTTAIGTAGRRHAALLAVGPGAALSFETAAYMWSLIERDPPKVHVSTTRTKRVGAKGSVVHHPVELPVREIEPRDGASVTSLFRTLRDMAIRSEGAKLRRMVEVAVTRHHVDPMAVATYARLTRRRPGGAKLAIAARAVAGPVRLRSDLETNFRTLAEKAGFPAYEANVVVGGWELDVYWELAGVAVELDWWTYHGGPTAYRRDRKKGLALARLGIELVRVAGEDMEEVEDEVIETVGAVLDRRLHVET